MIFDFYEQADLFRIAKCGVKSTLEDWLRSKRIPYHYDAKNRVIVHKDALAAAFGAKVNSPTKDIKLWLGEEDAA